MVCCGFAKAKDSNTIGLTENSPNSILNIQNQNNPSTSTVQQASIRYKVPDPKLYNFSANMKPSQGQFNWKQDVPNICTTTGSNRDTLSQKLVGFARVIPQNWDASSVKTFLETKIDPAALTLWGKGSAKTFEQLALELVRGECSFMTDSMNGGEVVRCVEIIWCNIPHPKDGGKLLVEEKRVYTDTGMVRPVNKILGGKRRPLEPIASAARRVIEKELRLDSGVIIADNISEVGIGEDARYSPSYPGIKSIYKIHMVDCQIDTSKLADDEDDNNDINEEYKLIQSHGDCSIPKIEDSVWVKAGCDVVCDNNISFTGGEKIGQIVSLLPDGGVQIEVDMSVRKKDQASHLASLTAAANGNMVEISAGEIGKLNCMDTFFSKEILNDKHHFVWMDRDQAIGCNCLVQEELPEKSLFDSLSANIDIDGNYTWNTDRTKEVLSTTPNAQIDSSDALNLLTTQLKEGELSLWENTSLDNDRVCAVETVLCVIFDQGGYYFLDENSRPPMVTMRLFETATSAYERLLMADGNLPRANLDLRSRVDSWDVVAHGQVGGLTQVVKNITVMASVQ